MDEDDDLLTPYKEESYEIYEKRMTEESEMWIAISSSSEDEIEVDTPIMITPCPPIATIVHEQEDPPIPVENGNIRKRGRPRKRKIHRPSISELPPQELCEFSEPVEEKKDIVNNTEANDSWETTAEDVKIEIEGPKRKLGRPRKDEITVNSQKKMLQALRCIIPDGVKRKARPSCMLDDFEAFMLKEDSRDSFRKLDVYTPSFKGKMKGKRGRPRIHPVKVKIMLPDGRPRPRGRPRLCESDGLLSDSKPIKAKRIKKEASSSEPLIRNYPGCSPFTLSGTVRKRFPRPGRKLGRPPKGQEKTHKILIKRENIDANSTHVKNEVNCSTSQPDDDSPSKPKKVKIEENDQQSEYTLSKRMKLPGKKRIAGPGKKLGRPRKGEERNVNILKNPDNSPWKIKLKGLFKKNQLSNTTHPDEASADDAEKLKIENPETEIKGLDAIDTQPDQDLMAKNFGDDEISDEGESSNGSSIYEIVHDTDNDSIRKANGNYAMAPAESVRIEGETSNCTERITPRSTNSPQQKDGKDTSASKLSNGVDGSKINCNQMALSKLLSNSSLEISNSDAFPADKACKSMSTKNQSGKSLPSSHHHYNSPNTGSCFEMNRNSERAEKDRVNYALTSPYHLEMSES